MKKSLLALAVLGIFAGAASAQSSVTLSGGVDVGVRYIGPTKDWNMATSGSSRSFFTLSGTEDLGGGMKAIFLLNHRFRPNDGAINVAGNVAGTSPQYFWRNAWVGLAGGFGDVRLGRILMPLQDFNGGFEPWWGGDTVGNTHTGGPVATVRATNTIYYRSPSMGGLQLHAAIAAGEGQIAAECGGCAPLNSERPVGLGLRYDAGPLSAALAYDRNTADFDTVGLYAKYNFGRAVVYGQYEKSEINSAIDDNRFSIGADIPFGAWTGKVGVLRIDRDLIGGGDAKQTKLGLGLWYALSKRTSLYTDMGKPSGDNLTTGANLTSAEKRASFDLGIRHAF